MAISATIKNPLTIIAIFAGIVEVGSTTVLPFLQPDVQFVYVWFLMVFPTTLVVAFFATLNLNHKVLYAPSDYQDDSSFERLATNAVTNTKLSNNTFGDLGVGQ